MINEEIIYNATTTTKGSAGPSGMNSELYRRILCSKNFKLKIEGKILREEFAVLTRNLLKTSYHPSLLEAFTSCRLLKLNKNPGIRPIGVGEVLSRIVGKTIAGFLKEEIKEAAGPLQVCAGHSAGAEAAIHAMRQVFAEERTDRILLIDAINAFNTMNKSVALHNIQLTCKEIALYIIIRYRSPSRLFFCGGGDILSQEGTTQGDPLAMPWYSVNTALIIQSLRKHTPSIKQLWLANDSAGSGRIEPLFDWYKNLCREGKKFGYLVNGSDTIANEAKKVFGDEVNITTDGQCHLRAIIGSKEYKDHLKLRGYNENMVSKSFENTRKTSRFDARKKVENKRNTNAPIIFSTAFNPRGPNVKEVVNRFLPLLQNVPNLKDMFADGSILVANKRENNLADLLLRSDPYNIKNDITN